jgi:diguanylate cyclase (GGDEF)-like protein
MVIDGTTQSTASNRQRILLIDDDPLMAVLLESHLTDDPIDLLFACGGEAGLVAAAKHQPDLILLDVEMPELDGFEVCRRLKADPATSALQIVFLTGAASIEQKVRGWDLGAVDYVLKPFEPAELRARVRASLRTKALVDLLSRKAMLDGLTGLYNRAYFDRRLDESLALQTRGSCAFACLLVDIDHFKLINDRFGHPFGDRVLCGVAAAMSDTCRREDVLCRYGGEEFALLAPATVGGGAQKLAERLRAAVERIRFSHERERVRVTCSIGVGDTTGGPCGDIVATVDAALYDAKRAGRNRVVVGTPSTTMPEPALQIDI